MKKDLILLVVLLLVLGCSSVYEDPDDSFAPRPENAKSDSYQIVRLGEERTSSGIRKNYLLEMIEAYRDKYKSIKVRSDFNSDYVGEHSYEKYLKNVQAFKDSDLDAAEEYIKSFPDSLKFTSTGLDEGKYDIGDINWRSNSRKLRISDFHAQRYTDDWSAYAFAARYGHNSCSACFFLLLLVRSGHFKVVRCQYIKDASIPAVLVDAGTVLAL